MRGDLFTAGNKVELRPINKTTKEVMPRAYLSRISEVLEDGKLEILVPIEKMQTVLLDRDVRFEMIVHSAKGLRSCEIKILDRVKKDGIHLQVVEIVGEVSRYQRREYYRYECTMPILSRHLTDEERMTSVWNEKAPGEEGVTVNLGGGGVRFVCQTEYEPDEMILCVLRIKVKGKIRVIQSFAKVIAVVPLKENGKKNEIRVKFVNMSSNDKEAIIQYIFEDERRKRSTMSSKQRGM